MRRTSFVAPLLLIAVGALFLARNIYPDLDLLDYVAKYWPFVLIAWGGLRLLEILTWAATSKPLPARGISGGEWVLIVFLCFAGTSLHTVRGLSSWWPDRVQLGSIDFFGERYEYPVSGEKECARTPRIVLEDFRGNAHISGVDSAAGMVKVTGRKTVRSLDQSRADQANDDTHLEIAGDANNVVIRLQQDRARPLRTVSATLDISVPKGSSIEVHGRNGDLEVNDITGSVSLTSDNAGVHLKNIGGDARLDLRRSDVVHMESVQGAVDIKGRGSDLELEDIGGPVSVNGAYNGTIQLRHLTKPLRFTGPQTELSLEGVPGQIHMTLGDFAATDVVGPTRLSSRSRDVEISNFAGALDVTVERGDLALSTGKLPLGRIQARSRSGDIRLSLPAAAQFTISASTNNGDIANDFGGPLKLEQSGRRGTLRGSVGNGPSVELETRRGQIMVQKAGAATVTPTLQKLDQ
jgi:DUF4097 and DUF4098 domain-containing protein YvlB